MEQEVVQELLTLDQKAKRFFEILREQSMYKNDPVPEWKVVPEVECEDDGTGVCICSTPIVYKYCIENKHNGNRLTIGSECVKRWNLEFTCKDCKAPLGNVTQRLLKKNFFCPECTKRKKNQEKIRQQMLLARQKELERYTLFWYGPDYKRKFKDVIQDIPYVERLINVEYKTKTLELFQEYVSLLFDIVDK